MLEIFDSNRLKKAILQNAVEIKINEKINSVNYLYFTIPLKDSKNRYCIPFNLARYDGVTYRIIDSTKDAKARTITYKCEHIIASLIDNVLYSYHVVGNKGVYTKDVINYVLKHNGVDNQTGDFILKQCDFARQFEYGWEQENKLTALFNIPSNFTEKYIWKFNTLTYPYEISLLALNENKQIADHYLRTELNLLNVVKQSDATNIVTRLYCLGAGEGVNQLKINGNYIQSPKAITDKYGIKERIWIDRRYTDKQSLTDAGKKMLEELQEPYVQYSIDYADLQNTKKTVEIGDIVEIIDSDTDTRIRTYIVSKNTTIKETKSIKLGIANKPNDIAGSIAELADRQRIEMAYSQGSTQLYAMSQQDNADSTDGLELDFFVPNEASIINSVNLKIKTNSFRAYSKATASAGDFSKSVSSVGGGSYKEITTSVDGGGSTNKIDTTSEGGGGTTNDINTTSGWTTIDFSKWGKVTWPPAPEHYAKYGWYLDFTEVVLPSEHRHDVKTSVTIPPHTHDVKTSVTIPPHTHDVSINIPPHTHDVSIEIPKHTHDITYGIYRSNLRATSFTLYINNKAVQTVNGTNLEIDITKYLATSNGMIPRGQWLTIKVVPNNLAYISVAMSFQGYIQSRGDNTV